MFGSTLCFFLIYKKQTDKAISTVTTYINACLEPYHTLIYWTLNLTQLFVPMKRGKNHFPLNIAEGFFPLFICFKIHFNFNKVKAQYSAHFQGGRFF